MKDTNLREVEKRTYMSYHQDGLLDIFVGIYILLFGSGILLFTLMDYSTWFILPAIFPAIMIPVWVSAKKKITMPRIGYVKIGSKGSNKLMSILIGLMVVGLGMFMILAFAADQTWAVTTRDLIISYIMILIGVGGAAISSLFAYTTGLKRLYGYGLLTLVLFVSAHFINLPMAYLLVVIGVVLVVYGFVLLVRFTRKYPLIKGGRVVE
jgi:hypothetical protein